MDLIGHLNLWILKGLRPQYILGTNGGMEGTFKNLEGTGNRFLVFNFFQIHQVRGSL